MNTNWTGEPTIVLFVMADKSRHAVSVKPQSTPPYGNLYHLEDAINVAGKAWLGAKAWFYTWRAREFKYRKLKDKIICFIN